MGESTGQRWTPPCKLERMSSTLSHTPTSLVTNGQLVCFPLATVLEVSILRVTTALRTRSKHSTAPFLPSQLVSTRMSGVSSLARVVLRLSLGHTQVRMTMAQFQEQAYGSTLWSSVLILTLLMLTAEVLEHMACVSTSRSTRP